MNQDTFESSALELKERYKNTPGIIKVNLDDFLGDTIIITVDVELLSIEIPKSFRDVPVYIFDVYANYKGISETVDSLIVNEPSLWENKHDPTLESLFALCESYKKIIIDYEREKKHGRRNYK